MVLTNALANIIPLGGNTTGQVSEKYPNLFTPVPITFAIWAVIYLFMGWFVLWQWAGRNNDVFIRKIGPWFSISCFFNTAWIFFWHYERIDWSVFCIVWLLISLIVINRQIAVANDSITVKLIRYGFEIYFGWIIAATIANISVLLAKLEWNGFGLSEQFWTAAILVVGMIITVLTVIIGHYSAAGLAVIWAYVGIIIRHLSANYYNNEYPYVVGAAIISIALIFSAMSLGIAVKNNGLIKDAIKASV